MALKDSKMVDFGYGNLLAGIQRGQDKADKAREREEDRVFTREQKKQDQDFSKAERIEGQIFVKDEAKLSRDQEKSVIDQKGDIASRQIGESAKEQRQNQSLQGKIDIKKINTSGGLEALRQKERLVFTGGENAKDRVQKGQLFDKEWTEREKQWRAQLDGTKNLAHESKKHDKWLAEFEQTGNEKLLRERFTFDASESALGRDASALALDKTLSGSALSDKLRINSNEKINSANIIATATENVLKRAHAKGISKQEAQQRANNYELKLKDDFKFYKKQGNLGLELARIGKEQEADRAYSFQKSPYQSIFDESKAGGFNETDVLDEYFGYGEGESAKTPVYGALSMEVTKALETSPENAQRQELLGTLIRLQDRFSDPEFHDYGSQAAGESNKAQGAVQDIQGLITRLGYSNRVKPLVKEQFEGLSQGDLGASSFLYNTGSNIGSGLYNMVTDTPNERPINIPDNVTY
tara:strand:- start:18837 stop:20240 length:1404 start_codon:yes stop_codon:yes gene_type:complete